MQPAGEVFPEGSFVFRRTGPGGGSSARPIFTIVLRGTNLGTGWRHTRGLTYLHRLVRTAGREVHVDDLVASAHPGRDQDYRVRADDVEAPDEVVTGSGGNRFVGKSTRELKQRRDDARVTLKALAEGSLYPSDLETREEKQGECERDIEALTAEIERREDPALKKQMNAVQTQLKKAVEELRVRMQEKGVPTEYLSHFNHCTSSEDHPYHFCYAPAVVPDWATD